MAFEKRASSEEIFDERVERVATWGSVRLIAVFALALLVTVAGLGGLWATKPRGAWALASVMLLLFASVALLYGRLWRAQAVAAPPRRLILRAGGLYFESRDKVQSSIPAIALDGPFGLTLLANRARHRVALVVTTPSSSFYVGAVVAPEHLAECRALLAEAFTVASDESALDAAAPDGNPFFVAGPTLARLHAALLARDERCTTRLYLSDARGQPIALDGATLRAGTHVFDLALGLEWHGLRFREISFAPTQTEVGNPVGVYQATRVRQGDNEVVFVALMPALSAPAAPGDTVTTGDPVLERAVLRDMTLLNVALGSPPPAALRVAVERVFMLPLRAALNTAPTQAAAPPGQRERPPGSMVVS